MAGTFNKPQRKSAAVTEWLDLARDEADAALTETTQAHRDDGFLSGEAADPGEFSYIQQRLHRWIRRNGVTLVASHRTASITIGGAVTTGDTRRLSVTTPAVFAVDYATQASDASNGDIAANWAAAINADSTASIYMTATASGADIYVEWLEGARLVTWAASQPVVVGTPTTTLAEVVSDTQMTLRLADDDNWNGAGIVVGSTQYDDEGTGAGDDRMFFDVQTGAFRAGTVAGTQWDASNRGDHSAAFGEDTIASGDWSLAAGDSCTASGDNSVCAGNASTASGLYAVAVGNACDATNTSAVAIGGSCLASGVASLALVTGHATGDGAASIGSAEGGNECLASGNYSLAAGRAALASSADSIALGRGAVAHNQGLLAVGAAQYEEGGTPETPPQGQHAEEVLVFGLSKLSTGTGYAVYTPQDETTCLIRAHVTTYDVANTDTAAFQILDIVIRRTGGTTTLLSTPSVTTIYDESGVGNVSVAVSVSSPALRVGIANSAAGAFDVTRSTVAFRVTKLGIA